MIPTIVVGGFLGAGKTTLLRRLLADPGGIRYGVLLNDFGDLDIDGALLAEQGADRIVLDNGCICCAVPGSLADALETLLRSDPAPERILIETSGISRPLPVAALLGRDAPAADAPATGRPRLDGLYCLIDAVAFPDLDYADTELALDQATGADLVILNKADLAGPDRLAAVEATLRAAMPRIRLLPTSHAAVPPGLLFAGSASPALDRHHHHHDEEWQTWSWQSGAPLDPPKLRRALRTLPPGVLRTKGVSRALAFQTIGKHVEVSPSPGVGPTSAIAVGRRGAFDPAALTALFESCRADPAP